MVATNNALARPADIPSGLTSYEPTEVTLIRQQYAKGLNEGQFQMFLAEANHRGLDILQGHFQSIVFNGSNPTFFPTIHGLMFLANQHPMNDGVDEVEYCGPDGVFRPVWPDDKTPPVAARATVHRKDRSRPTIRVAYLSERRRPGPTWQAMTRHMLGKVALSDAIKASGLINEAEQWMFEDVAVLPDGSSAQVVDGQQVNAFKRAHAIAAAKGRSHEEVREAVKQIEPGITSMREASPDAIHTAASVIDNMNPEYVDKFIEGKVSLEDPAVDFKPFDEPDWDALAGNPSAKPWSELWKFMRSRYQVNGEQFAEVVGATALTFGSPKIAIAAYRESIGETSPATAGEVDDFPAAFFVDPETGEIFDVELAPDWEETVDIAYLAADAAGADEAVNILKAIYGLAGIDPNLWTTILSMAPTEKALNHARLVQRQKCDDRALDAVYAARELELKAIK